ncbi:hypothetical protein DA792_18630 [Celeribacter baekdonensis]|uniref:Uncharacterized protein n=1 Tax=Celeribacter baekdonensis TaxID=875171 RepID=A0A2R4M6W0_9RHOB|nr:hypothetical protein DA792_18630 [Celeribacter baekdonensis]
MAWIWVVWRDGWATILWVQTVCFVRAFMGRLGHDAGVWSLLMRRCGDLSTFALNGRHEKHHLKLTRLWLSG